MHRSRGAPSSSTPDKVFASVRFVLFGFDSVSEAQYRSEIIRRGGIDVGRYDQSCTHVIVSGRVYDDPVCVAARNDGKILVTELWVDDSLVLGMLADAARILYSPIKDLNGIPGSNSLHVCLTGYQRQQRDDVMKMVSLMGAKFSKPLVANQVTHLICYKFEGEKYELAKKVNIKLVNHRWLEDCLKAWAILPIDNYKKSGWEIEVLEAEAKDSDEETEDVAVKSLGRSNMGNSTFGHGLSTVGSDLSIPSFEKLSFPKDNSATIHSDGDNHIMDNKLFMTPCKVNSLPKPMSECNLGSKVCHEKGGDVTLTNKDHATRDTMVDGEPFNRFDSNLREAHSLPAKTVLRSSIVDVKSSTLTYSRKSPYKSASQEELLVNFHTLPKGLSKGNVPGVDFDISPSYPKESRVNDEPAKVQGSSSHAVISNIEANGGALPQKRKVSDSGGSKSPKSECQSSIHSAPQHLSPNMKSALVEAITNSTDAKEYLVPRDADHLLENGASSNSSINQQESVSKFKSFSCRKKSLSCIKPVMGKVSNAVLSPSNAKKHDIPSPKMTLDEQECRIINLSNVAPMVTSTIVSSIDGKALLDLPLDDDIMQVNDKQAIVRNTANKFGSLAVGELTHETSCNDKRPDIFLGSTGKHELVAMSGNGENGETATIDVQNVITKEHTQTHSPDGMVIGTGNPSITVSADPSKGNNVRVASGAHTKKAVAKRSFSRKSMPNIFNSRKDKHVDPDKSPQKVEVISGNLEKVDKKVSRNLKDGAVEPVSDNEVLKERMETAEDPMPTSPKMDVTMMDWKATTSMDPEKENMLEKASRFNSDCTSDLNSKSINKLDQKPIQSPNDSCKMKIRKSKKIIHLDPAWFILSGHRLQRKEFQAIIRRLRGRICRDSHHWSYQATHFIAPDPVRRTEKFFAAAAGGRWILKTEYLSASNEFGKFLDEEPFEWHSKGLTEDGAISLQAPRKWRLLRERTGHGAFFKMRIVIYGECIAPTLDTIKRVVKAGDGTILATSPPYTRFLKSAVDYAIISPSMPRVDSWVQEFLRHEIPCVSADYLVEYVCKPGYSLERHVLYRTHSWAEKSFAHLLSCSEEISEDARLASEECSDDLSCAICGSRERGEVMLICGDEAGTVGCGIGIHINCCDPPLESVPEGDWFCSKCSSMFNKPTPLKNGRKVKSSSKPL